MVWNYFGIVSILIIAFAIKSDNTSGIIGAAIYGFCFFTTFTFSTLYHGIQHAQANAHLKFLITSVFIS
jgi:hemolysin III